VVYTIEVQVFKLWTFCVFNEYEYLNFVYTLSLSNTYTGLYFQRRNQLVSINDDLVYPLKKDCILIIINSLYWKACVAILDTIQRKLVHRLFSHIDIHAPCFTLLVMFHKFHIIIISIYSK